MPLDPETRLGRYEIRELLGAGGMGEVYRAHDAKLDRDVAVKVLPAAFAEDASAVERFEREARAVATLEHPLWVPDGTKVTFTWLASGGRKLYRSTGRNSGAYIDWIVAGPTRKWRRQGADATRPSRSNLRR